MYLMLGPRGVLTALAFVTAAAAAEGDWPRWRGPNDDGIMGHPARHISWLGACATSTAGPRSRLTDANLASRKLSREGAARLEQCFSCLASRLELRERPYGKIASVQDVLEERGAKEHTRRILPWPLPAPELRSRDEAGGENGWR